MPCEILINAEDKNHTKKGAPKMALDTPAVWGLKENLAGGYVKLRITDATVAQVKNYFKSWHKKLTYEILNENASGYRIRVSVDSALIAVGGLNSDIKSEMKFYITIDLGATMVSHTASEIVVDIAKPVDLLKLKSDLNDMFAEEVDHRQFYFTSADVDFAMTQPDGIVEKTKAQVLSMIKNKLDD